MESNLIAFLSVILVIALLAIIPAYVMYFASLYYFGKSMRESHPEIYSRYEKFSFFAQSYSALQAIRSNPDLVRQLDPDVLDQLRRTYRYLVIGASCFMILLLAGLGISVASKA
nr:putative integron gene cassette protein [uncultured bacterium]CAP48791.1 putative integron gene cassette protein [uncultured bacterium]CAP48792.1 putative integron gene cassette protein [uncultured bacterium]CAP49145.1 putative integron gene cassette protein [uncultured bacterium]CAP49147.1 putative integron gene cassette protein [uncultured bacterium]